MGKKLINPERLYDGAPLGMSQAVLDPESSLLFVSGQVDWDHRHQVSQNSVSGQFKVALEHLRTVLAEAGSSVDNLLHVRVYIRGELEDHMEALAPIMAGFLGSSRPAVTGIGVASLASKATLVEVEAVAKVDKGKEKGSGQRKGVGSLFLTALALGTKQRGRDGLPRL